MCGRGATVGTVWPLLAAGRNASAPSDDELLPSEVDAERCTSASLSLLKAAAESEPPAEPGPDRDVVYGDGAYTTTAPVNGPSWAARPALAALRARGTSSSASRPSWTGRTTSATISSDSGSSSTTAGDAMSLGHGGGQAASAARKTSLSTSALWTGRTSY